MATNKKLGNTFETAFCEILFAHGFWCHLFSQNQAGQPADVIAAKNGDTYLIDCKVCSGKGFPLSRIEENQHLSMGLWKDCGNGDGWFALKFGEEIIMVSRLALKVLSYKKSSFVKGDIPESAIPLAKWIEKCR